MVLGIFMCTCLVGVLWYLAGIGEAVVFRERVQEASDAAAFSSAVLQARGMNLIVLINLIMACVLGIRVALKVVQLTLVILGAIFSAIGWFVPPVAPFGVAAFQGATQVQNILNQVKNPIDNTLKALSAVQKTIARVVPAASLAGGAQVGRLYQPGVSSAWAATDAATLAEGLPLEEGSGERLCFEAGRAFASLIWWALPDSLSGLEGGTPGEYFTDTVGTIVERGGAYFCENGSGGSAPNLDDILDDTANQHCDAKRDDVAQKLSDASRAWHTRCDALGVVCTDPDPMFQGSAAFMGDTSGLTPAQRSELNDLKQERDARQQEYDEFNWGQCKNQKMGALRDDVRNNSPPPGGGGGTSQNMTPKKTKADWRNGANKTQIMGLAWGDERFIRMAPKGVKIGAMRSRTEEIENPQGADFAFSQTEFFYDCRGAWGGNSCNGEHRNDNEDAMWHCKWRARFRRYNRPYNNLSTFLEIPYVIPAHGEMIWSAANGTSLRLTSPGNIALKADLTRFLNPADTLSVTIH
jgi:hypothetical protein